MWRETALEAFAALGGLWFWEQDANLRFTYISKSIERLPGPSAASHIGKTREDLGVQYDGGETWAVLQHAVADRQPFADMRFRRPGPDGAMRYFSTSGEPVFDAAGAFQGYRGIGKEITERVLVDEAYKLMNERLVGLAGDIFFAEAIAAVAELLGADYAYIGEVGEPGNARIEILAAHDKTQAPAETTYALAGTPCAQVIATGGSVTHRRDVRKTFPDDARLARRRVQSYVACPLIEASGAIVGVIVLMRETPLGHPETALSILRALALRVIAERQRWRSEQALAASEARFQTFFDHLPGQAFIKNLEGRFVWVNRNFSMRSGRPPEFFIGRTAKEAIGNPVTAQALVDQDRAIIETGAVMDIEVNLSATTGSELWMRCVKFPILDGDGAIAGIGGVNLDVSARVVAEKARDEAMETLQDRIAERTQDLEREVEERRRVERAVKESEARLREVLEACPMGVSIVADAPFRRLFQNRRMGELLIGDAPLDVADIPGIETFVNPDDYYFFFREIAAGNRLTSMEFERKRPGDGTRWWSLVDAGPIRFEGQNAVIVWLYDITERVAAEDALKRNEQRIREILESSTAGISILRQDPIDRVFANRRMLEFFGVETLEELNAFGFENTIVNVEEWKRAYRTITETGALDHFVIERARPDGSSFWLLIDARTIQFEGEAAIIFWHFDITDQKRVEADLRETLDHLHLAQDELIQSERMVSLGQMVAGMAHEINTPLGVGLTAVSVLAQDAAAIRQSLEDGALTRTQFNAFVETVDEGASVAAVNLRQAADLVRNFKQVAVDQSSEERRNFNLFGYVQEVIGSLMPALKDTRHTIAVTGDRDVELESIPGAFAQILSNLVMNSLLHGFDPGDAGHIKIKIERDGDFARLIYRENGKGMEPSVLKRIFEPFFTTKRGKGGSGLGMNIVYNLATQSLRGTIKCDSSPGKGIEVDIHVPISN